jgi:hypothetical protein
VDGKEYRRRWVLGERDVDGGFRTPKVIVSNVLDDAYDFERPGGAGI